MGELGILHGEPRHRVEDFRREVLGRAAEVVAEMGPQLDGLLRRVLGCLEQFKAAHLMVGLEGVRIMEPTWWREGWVRTRFMVDVPVPPDPDEFHAVVDPFVDDCVSAHDLPASARREFKQWLAGWTKQFCAIKRHSNLDLRRVVFEDFEWVRPNVLQYVMRHGGRTMLPRDLGWD